MRSLSSSSMSSLFQHQVLLIATAVVFVVNVIFNIGGTVEGPMLDSIYGGVTTKVRSDSFPSVVTPPGWAFSIWSVIYLSQVLWLAISAYLLFFKKFCLVPRLAYVLFILACVFNTAWLILYAHQVMVATLLVIILLLLALDMMFVWSLFNSPPFQPENLSSSLFYFSKYFYLNAICLYSTWVFVATHLNLDNLMLYYGSDRVRSGITVSAMLLVFVFAIGIIEVVVFRRFTKHVYTFYPVLIFVSIAVMAKEDVTDSYVVLGIFISLFINSCILFAIKLLYGTNFHKVLLSMDLSMLRKPTCLSPRIASDIKDNCE